MRLLLPAAVLLICSLFAQASKHLGVWLWQETGSPYGASNIVGNSVLENQTVSFLQSRLVKRVYGSYGAQPVTDAPAIAAWNAKLQAGGIKSQFLMSENTWIFPTISHRLPRENQPARHPLQQRSWPHGPAEV